MDWDKIRTFLAIARNGQLSGAARKLGINHATIGRQLTALEMEIDAKLVERDRGGCRLTSAGEAVLAVAERVESELLRLETGLSGTAGILMGTVRVGAPDAFGNLFLAARLSALAMRHPNLVVQLVPLPRSFSLSRREADIAITLDRPSQGNLIVQKLSDYSLGVYASADYLANHPPILKEEDLAPHMFITFVDDFVYSPSLDYGRELASQMRHRFECGSVSGQMEAVRAGNGVAILHDFAVQNFPELKRVLPEKRYLRNYWLVSHPDTHDAHRVAEVRRHIIAAVQSSRRQFVPKAE